MLSLPPPHTHPQVIREKEKLKVFSDGKDNVSDY